MGSEEASSSSAPRANMKLRLYLGQHESLRLKRARTAEEPQNAEITVVQKEVKGIKFITGKQKSPSPDFESLKKARMSSHGIPADLIPELIARRAGSPGSSDGASTSHHLDFWEDPALEASTSQAPLSVDSWKPMRGSLSPKAGRPSSPKKSQKRPPSSGTVSWKSKRGRFAEAVPGQDTEPFYEWMPFLQLLKANADYPEFVYLQPPKVCGSAAFDPYELEIVSHNELDSPYYYTMSAAGVTLFRDSDAEFSQLHEWEQEYASYKCVMKLNVFRQYKLWKNFAIWRHFVRRKVQGVSKKSLKKQLFSINVVLQKVLLKVRALLVDLESMRYFKLDNETPYTLQQYIQAQEVKRDEITKRLQQVSSEMIATLKDGCIASLYLIDEEIMGRQNIETESPPSSAGGDPNAAPRKRSSGAKLANVAAKWKMDKEKQLEEKETQERFKFAIAAAKRNAKFRLLNFLRLVDYMTSDMLRGILLKSYGEFIYRVAHSTVKHTIPLPNQNEAAPLKVKSTGIVFPTKKPPISPTVFEVDLVMDNDQIVIMPSNAMFDQKFGHHLRSIIRRIKALKRLVYVPDLDEVVEKGNMESGDNPSTYMDLVGESELNTVGTLITQSFNLVFQDGDVRKEYDHFVVMFVENKSFSIDRMEQELKEKKRDMEVFRADMDVFLQQIEDINALPAFNDVMIFRVFFASATSSSKASFSRLRSERCKQCSPCYLSSATGFIRISSVKYTLRPRSFLSNH